MRWVGVVLRAFGWLLTPAVALAAAFFGALGGAILADRVPDPLQGFYLTAAVGAVTGFAGILLWLRLLRANPELRRALAVSEDGTPDTITQTLERVIGDPTAEPPPDPPPARAP